MPIRQPPQLTHHARKLRTNQTKPESLVWTLLRNRRLNGHKFRRQCPIPPFIADFACAEKRLIVELDGDHHEQQAKQDMSRTAHLNREGWTVIRFCNADVLENTEAVGVAILRAMGEEWRGRE
ncbi:protein of unknown function DUF559 [Rhodopirellula islandica]|uniref:DUF559 domain-containing protein n=1 Tax=Rhodopirellula islandica TaxID=595434 RepID=A0A0J1B3V8_RHOIS|nr:DUF559 domain-containing protein [Rhodopirellula islandica]KLU01525.1 protein of unknown function DUF559 [Rhodopirellula islandica]